MIENGEKLTSIIKMIFNDNIFKKYTIAFIIFHIIISVSANHVILNNGSLSYLGGFVNLSNIIMIVLISNIIAKELKKSKSYKDIYNKNNALQIFITNILALILFYFFLLIIAIFLTTIVNIMMFHFVSISFIFNNKFLIFIIGDILNKFLLLSIILLIASLTNIRYELMIIIGLFIFIFGDTISVIFVEIMKNHMWLRWNPFNFLLINLQLTNKGILGSSIHSSTLLNNVQMIIGTLFYGGIAYIISGYYFIKRISFT